MTIRRSSAFRPAAAGSTIYGAAPARPVDAAEASSGPDKRFAALPIGGRYGRGIWDRRAQRFLSDRSGRPLILGSEALALDCIAAIEDALRKPIDEDIADGVVRAYGSNPTAAVMPHARNDDV
jgi:hypothetical protein